MSYTLEISVIIPTFNRSNKLMQALLSFAKQTIPMDAYEVIVSDNNSTDDTVSVVQTLASSLDSLSIKYIFESRQGVHYARNTAAKHAAGRILYFTDDDMVATENLLQEILTVFLLDPSIAVATGQVLPRWEADPPSWIQKYCRNSFLSLISRPERLIVARHDVGVYSCHQAILSSAFFKTGGFHPENTAGVWIGDGETGLNQVVKNLGYSFAYTEKSIIYHCIPKERMTQAYLNKRLYNQGFCDSYSYYRLPGGQRRLRVIKSIFASMIKIIFYALTAMANLILLDDHWHLRLAYCFYHTARIVYNSKLLSSAEWRALVLRSDWLSESSETALGD